MNNTSLFSRHSIQLSPRAFVRKNIPLISAALIAGGLILSGCGDHGHTETQSANSCGMAADTFSAGMQKTGTQQKLNIKLMTATPAPPAKGDNTWVIQVSDTANMPIEGATIQVTPFMPEHGHGSSIDVIVTPKGSGGEYTLDPINFSMPGVWEITIDITTATGTSDSLKFAFCIEG